MNRLDDLIRSGLTQAAATISEPSADRLAGQLTARRNRSRRRTQVARAVLATAAAFVALAATFGVLTRLDDGSDRVDTVLPPADGRGFAAYAPGWHEFDMGVASMAMFPSLAWTGRELVVADVISGTTRSRVMAYSPTTRTWRDLGVVPVDGGVTVAWAGDHLVVIGDSFPAAPAAIWDDEDERWEVMDPPPISKPMASTLGGLRPVNSDIALVWTGQRLLDLTHGAALDPRSRRWTTMAMPEAVADQRHLFGFTPVWDGREVVLASWATEPGLAWNSTGSAYREIPGLPADIADPGLVLSSVATRHDGRVLLVSGTDHGSVASFDGRTSTWQREPSMTGMRSEEGCPSLAATVAGRAVVMPCTNDTPVVLGDAGWEPIGPHPFPTPCCGGVWIDAGSALVAVWSTGGSNGKTWEEPKIRAAVWVPPGS